MKFNFKFRTKTRKIIKLNTLYQILIYSFLIIGVVSCFLTFYFTKKMLTSLIFLLGGTLLSLVAFIFGKEDYKKKNDISSNFSLKTDFINKITTYLLNGDNFKEAFDKAKSEIKTSSFKEDLNQEIEIDENGLFNFKLSENSTEESKTLESLINNALNKNSGAEKYFLDNKDVYLEMISFNNDEDKKVKFLTYGIFFSFLVLTFIYIVKLFL